MKILKSILTLCTLLLIMTSCQQDDLNYFVDFKDGSGTRINNDTIAIPLDAVFSGSMTINAREGGNPQLFKNSTNITDSDEISLTRELFGNVYVQESDLNISVNATDFSSGDVIEIEVLYNIENGNTSESFFLLVE